MLMVNEIWVNWCYDEEKGYNVHEFHEWRNPNDSVLVKMIDRIPFLKIHKDLFSYIENSLNPLPIGLLEKIRDKGYYIKNYNKIAIKYCCVLTDGERYLVIDTHETQIPHKKSRLIPRQERKLHEEIETMEIDKFEYTPIAKKVNPFLTIDDEYMLGLTRRERVLKELLFYIFEQLQQEDNLQMMRYFYSEFIDIELNELNELSYDELFVSLFSEVKKSWSNKHHNLLKQLLKLNSMYKVIYDDEMSYEVKEIG